MKAMKNMKLKGMMDNLTRRGVSRTASEDSTEVREADTPEYYSSKAVALFCESGGPNNTEGDEVLHLPVIVDSAESSPAAASQCAGQIRKYLSKENYSRPNVQYNALMLVRILTDNPGPTFTRNMDAKFVATVKELLKTGRDPGVQQILRETLESFEKDKGLTDANLTGMVEMWKKEQVKLLKMYPNGVPMGLQGLPQQQSRVLNAPGWDPRSQNSQNYFARNHNSRNLPPPDELSSRIEEAKTSAKLLEQVVQSTPPAELLQSELVMEFSDRCQSASRSIQRYMHAENPGPDNDTMLTLIETNDQLTMAMSQHQRAALKARKLLGLSAATTPNASTPSNGASTPYAPPPGPPPQNLNQLGQTVPTRKNMSPQPAQPSNSSEVSAMSSEAENPFSDPPPPGASTTKTHNPPFPEDRKKPAAVQEERLGIEPYHPGFNATPSYVNRQNSAIDGVKMSSAIPERGRQNYEDDSEDEMESRSKAETSAQAPVYRY